MPTRSAIPASLTKIMTLYLLFEQIEAGKLRLDSQMEVSDHASQQAPSKLGLRPGQTLSVEDAIRALVTKSANDAAVVVAEAIGGDEETFATMMTRKARALGMSRTNYANASGLPDEDQVTTARDQVTLGRAIQDRFPRYYRYFATSSFVYRGHAMRNHNKLLGRVEGVDGIKTGYTRMSGFNLVSSVRRGNRHIVAVVLGGASGGARDARMRSLIEQNIASASTNRSVAKIAETTEVSAVAAPVAPAKKPRTAPRARRCADARSRAVERPRSPPVASRRCPGPRHPGAGEGPAARLGRADQPDQGEDHHGESRRSADRVARSSGNERPAGDHRAGAFCHERPGGGAPARPARRPPGHSGHAADRGGHAATAAPRHLSDRVGGLRAGHYGACRVTRSARPLAHPGRRIPEGNRGAGAAARGAGRGQAGAGEGRAVHREVRQGRQEYFRARFDGFSQATRKPPASTSSAPRWPASPSATDPRCNAKIGKDPGRSPGLLLSGPKSASPGSR